MFIVELHGTTRRLEEQLEVVSVLINQAHSKHHIFDYIGRLILMAVSS